MMQVSLLADVLHALFCFLSKVLRHACQAWGRHILSALLGAQILACLELLLWQAGHPSPPVCPPGFALGAPGHKLLALHLSIALPDFDEEGNLRLVGARV